ncbi:DNA primase [Entomospira entomophila]|uniref:DNA primase n=1 Tax=Entomospira entomophila TaxID=2719988 RepID=A0A968G8I9_9SPIO|nr:DNA primase [Entomospira entomophilus]NIZ40520.1 DNA primase [Entomospira entomophilus]WDI36078.1 DNA primase [Entomospira entomophilus]
MIIPKAVIAQVSQLIDIVELVSSYVSLQRKGERWWGCCPFHREKSPSFTVDPARRQYHCFGCNVHGDAVRFYMEMEGVAFPEAITILAQRVGVQITPESDEVQRELQRQKTLYELYQRLTGSFEHLLWHSRRGEQALAYLTKRNLSEESIRKFRIGYGMLGYNEVYQFLTKRGYSDAFLKESGLFTNKNPQYSFFRDRIVFPVIDTSGQVIAYSGRAMPDADKEAPKYINSPETLIFSKRKELFGMAQAKEQIRKSGEFILCEGAMDAIALHQMGHEQAVAPLGSAFTQEQLLLVKRFANKAILLMDGDPAGQKALRQAALICEEKEISVRAVRIQGGKDPSECLEYGQEDILTNSIKNATIYFDFLLQDSLKGVSKDNIEKRLAASEEIFSYISVVSSPIRRESHLQMLATKLQLSGEAVVAEYERYIKGKASLPSVTSSYTAEIRLADIVLDKDATIELLSACLLQPGLYVEYADEMEFIDFETLELGEIYRYLQEREPGMIDMDDLFERYAINLPIKELLLEKRLSAGDIDENWSERAHKAMSRIILQELGQRQSVLLRALSGVEASSDITIVSEMQREVKEINTEIQKIRGGMHG